MSKQGLQSSLCSSKKPKKGGPGSFLTSGPHNPGSTARSPTPSHMRQPLSSPKGDGLIPACLAWQSCHHTQAPGTQWDPTPMPTVVYGQGVCLLTPAWQSKSRKPYKLDFRWSFPRPNTTLGHPTTLQGQPYFWKQANPPKVNLMNGKSTENQLQKKSIAFEYHFICVKL